MRELIRLGAYRRVWQCECAAIRSARLFTPKHHLACPDSVDVCPDCGALAEVSETYIARPVYVVVPATLFRAEQSLFARWERKCACAK